MSIKSLYETIRNFLFSNMNKQLLTFLFFLILSGIFWLTITLNETYERELKIPVQIVGIPKNVVLTSPAVDTVRATIRDKGWMIVAYLHGDRIPKVTLNYKNYDRGNGAGIISSSDIKRLLAAFDALIERGHSIIVIEHNMEVIKCADHIIDLGPDGGNKGGSIVCAGTPEEVAKCKESLTGKYLKEKL